MNSVVNSLCTWWFKFAQLLFQQLIVFHLRFSFFFFALFLQQIKKSVKYRKTHLSAQHQDKGKKRILM